MHTGYEILLIVKGKVSYCIDGFRFSVKPYDLLFIPVNTYHFLIPEDNSEYENYVINIKEDFFDKSRLDKVFVPPYKINISDDSLMRGLFDNLHSYHQVCSREDFVLAAKNTVEQLIVYASYKPREAEVNDKSIAGRISQYIIENITEPLDAGIIAQKFNFAGTYIQNLFSKEMGIGLKHYINKKKIYAARFDICGGMSPLEAADKYGYKN